MKKSFQRVFSLILSAWVVLGLCLPLSARADEPMQVAATAAILIDADYGDVLFDQNAHSHRYPASITKVMTALLTLEAIDRGEMSPGTVVTARPSAMQGLSSDGSSQNIQAGEKLTVEELLYCILVASANEAANVLAEAVTGDVPSFVERMNVRAAELGMGDTNFVNTHGLHSAEHYTTAYDISLLVVEALKHDAFRTIVATKEYRIPATNLSNERHFYNTNALLSNWRYLGYTYSSSIGVKTGSTPEAGQCLASAAVEDGRTMIAVVLGAENVTGPDGVLDRQAFSESKRLLQWGFSGFSRKTIIDPMALLTEVEVTLSQETSSVAAHPGGTLEATLPNGVEPEDFERSIALFEESVQAPVEAGQVLGTVTLRYGGRDYGTLNLVAANDVARSDLLYTIARVEAFFSQIWVRLALLVLVALIFFLALRRFLLRGSRRRGRARYGGYAGRGHRRRK